MYRITSDIANFLIEHSKPYEIKNCLEDEKECYKLLSTKCIGVIRSMVAFCSDANYLIELFDAEDTNYKTSGIIGCWLYKQEELEKFSLPIEVSRMLIDPLAPQDNMLLDISSCAIKVASPIDKLTCPSVLTVERLIELEPKLRECLVL